MKNSIAIIGMAGRFPGAANVDEFWRNLRGGVESISFFSEQELIKAGVDPTQLRAPNYVKAKGVLEGSDLFDANFFGFSPRDAETMDPQRRIMLEGAWHALEDAGYSSESYDGPIGFFAGSSINTYLLFNLLPHRQLIEKVGSLQTSIHNRVDHLTTRVAYELNLKGPAITVQTACSTSLVAVHLACQSLLNGECDMALAGGVTVSAPPVNGYLHQTGGILSSDGHCRAFDASADGTVDGSGVGIVVLKRLEDAIADGDTIDAIIRGSAINNDGSLKVGYTAPGVGGQIEVIAEAQMVAGIPAETISYVEAHGTGTTLGDPIEVEALTEVFRSATEKRRFCALGSVKTNIGHLDVAAGVAGLIKTVLALKHRELPPSLHFERPNPRINFEETPFVVNAALRPWTTEGTPRRAGVSSFGIGGTNAHVVVEEAPVELSEKSDRAAQLVVLSAKSATALDGATLNLISHLKEHPETNLADVAYTLQHGRKTFDYRRIAVCHDTADAVRVLTTLDHRQVFTGLQEPRERPVVMMFPGQGSQYAGMGAELYAHEAVFREEVDRCAEILKPQLASDLRDVLFANEVGEASERLKQTVVTQPALFVIEYALAQQWISWGVSPAAMIGHSIGEYVAACLSGVMTLDDALALVAMRGRLMQSLPPGAMLVLSMPEDEVRALIEGRELSVASVNSPSLCVISGTIAAVNEVEKKLEGSNLVSRRLHTSHAFHSAMMDPIVEEFVAKVASINLRAPQIPYLSNLSGKWITAEEATDLRYWGRHLRNCVRFNDGVVALFEDRDRVFLEVGPGRTLSTLLRHHPQKGTARIILSSLRHPEESGPDFEYMLTTLGRLWLSGVDVKWSRLYEGERRRRVHLPTYPFERQRYWIDPPHLSQRQDVQADGKSSTRRADIAEWFYVPSWKRVPDVESGPFDNAVWLLFEDESGVGGELGGELSRQLRVAGRSVVTVKAGKSFSRMDKRVYAINPSDRSNYLTLLKELAANSLKPGRILHLWNVTGPRALSAEEVQQRSFYSLVYLAQALEEQGTREPLHLYVISDGMQEVTGEERLYPEKALALGPCRVIPQEHEHVFCRSVDVVVGANLQRLCKQLLAECALDEKESGKESVVAYRGAHRWLQTFEPLRLDQHETKAPRLRQRGVYLITGGLGGMALEFAHYLAQEARARLALVGRTPLPARAEWDHLLATEPESNATRRKIERVRALEALGAEVLILSADVADEAQFGAAVGEIRKHLGQINGVIHTAGVPGGGVMQLMNPETAAGVFAPKVNGARVIDAFFAQTPLDFLVLCSSRSSILGGFGHADYCAANAFLDSFAHDFSARTGMPAVSINWDAWAEVGMLINTAAQFGLRESRVESDTGHPLLDRQLSETADQSVYATRISPVTHWVLDDHRIVGAAIMPGTAYLEMARAAFERRESTRDETNAVEISQAFFLAPLGLRDDETREVRTVLEKDGDGYQFRIIGELPSENGSEPVWQDYAIGEISFTRSEAPRRYDLEALRARCGKQEILITDEYDFDPDLGPRWQSLQRVYLGERELLATFELPDEFAGDFGQFKLHPALLDRATGTAKHYLVSGGHYLPMSYKRLSVKRPLPSKIFAHIKFRDDLPQEETITFDIILMDESGTESVVIDGFSQKRVNDAAETFRGLARSNLATAKKRVAPQTAETEKTGAYQRALREGILPHEGIEAFKRILSNPLPPQVVVSVRDLQASIAEMSSITAADVIEEIKQIEVARPTTMHPRPASLTNYAEPRNEVERTLVEIFQTMLGIEQVGIHDNFFELGGDSVLGIQIIAQAKRAGIHLTPQQIFQHPTVAEMANIASDRQEPAQRSSDPATEEETQIDLSLTALDKSSMNMVMAMIDEDETEEQPLATAETIVIAPHNGDAIHAKELDFSVFFFAADNLRPGEDKYQLYLEGAKFADRNGFAAVWTPERHFHESGGLYPSPSVLNAALATITQRVKLRAGSVVMPLHHSIRVAEEWAVVDNLSHGRAGVSFTSGWIPNDFAFFPERYAQKREEMWRGIAEVQRLWRGESITARDGNGGTTELKVLPRPIQPELPIWITCSGDPEMFVNAGERGFNVLTALLTQSVDEVATKIAMYRQSLAQHGHDPASRQVTLMLHTFVGENLDWVLSKARTPLCNYLKAHVGLIETMTKSLNIKVGIEQEYIDDLVAFAFERYYQTASLIGTPEKCLDLMARLKQIGVDEVACFIDFGIDTTSVLDSLQHLVRLRDLFNHANEKSNGRLAHAATGE